MKNQTHIQNLVKYLGSGTLPREEQSAVRANAPLFIQHVCRENRAFQKLVKFFHPYGEWFFLNSKNTSVSEVSEYGKPSKTVDFHNKTWTTKTLSKQIKQIFLEEKIDL